MNTKAVAIALGIVLGLGQPLSAAVRQVRVTVQRAAIYVEPNRNSTRIDLVEKGDLLNLFQEQKVKNVWYYVVYNSPRYGSRISGFIQASAVELVTEETTPAEKPAPAPVSAGPEQLPKKVEPVPQRPPVETPPPETGKAASKSTPAREAAVVQKPAPVESREVAGLTPVPQARRVSLPRGVPAVDDRAWAVLQTAVPEIKKKPQTAAEPVPSPGKPAAKQVPKKIERQPQKPPVETPPQEPKKAAAKLAPAREEPILQNPEAPPSVTPSPAEPHPSKPAPLPRTTGRQPAPLTVGLGYGSSFGGAGGCLTFNLTPRLALHGGFGLYPAAVVYSDTDWVRNRAFWSVGVRYYPAFGSDHISPYFDLQYGGLRIEAAQVITGIFEFAYIYRHEQKTLMGPSLLAGLEIRLGRLAVAGGLGISYSLTDWEFLKQRLALAFEAGLSVRL
jgi:hypothetical protein